MYSKLKISILQRPTAKSTWGGDLVVLRDFAIGLRELGCSVDLVDSIDKTLSADFIFLTNICFDFRPLYNLLQLNQKKFGIIGFYEDILKYYSPCYGFYSYVRGVLEGKSDEGYPLSIERLIENPNLIRYYPEIPHKCFLINYHVIQSASLFITSSPTEKRTVKRDCPQANVKSILYRPSLTLHTDSTCFPEFIGVKSGQYILQVGRIEPRKNQLATILATKDLDIPLVFIATRHFKADEAYVVDCFKAIMKWRKAPTIIVSENIKNHQEGLLKIIQMPQEKKLSEEMMASAFKNAAVYCHPAFYELPGLVYLEAIQRGIATVASKWSAIKDYFIDESSGKYMLEDRVEYVLPYDIKELEAAIKKQLDRHYLANPDFPIFRRSKVHMAKELLEALIPLVSK